MCIFYGVALIAIILIEALILSKREQISYRESLMLSLYANVLSTSIGLVIFLIYSSTIYIIILLGIPISFSFAKMLKSFSANTGVLADLSRKTGLVVFIFAVVFVFVVPITGVFTISGHSYLNIRGQAGFSNAQEIIIAILAAFVLVIIGFFLSIISEGFIITRQISKRRKEIVSTIFVMNLISYTVLMLASTFFIWRTILEKGWFWHR